MSGHLQGRSHVFSNIQNTITKVRLIHQSNLFSLNKLQIFFSLYQKDNILYLIL